MSAPSIQRPSLSADWHHLAPPTDPKKPGREWWLSVLERALVSRAMDDLEVKELFPAGKLGFQFCAKGHEIPQIIAASLLAHPHDGANVYYRSRPFMLAAGLSPYECFASVMSKKAGVSGGRDIGVVFNLKREGCPTVMPASGDVGAQYTPGVGWAQAVRYHVEVLEEREYNGAIDLVLGGDGSVATNGFWSAINIAAPRKLPVVFLVEDNGYAISVPMRYQTSGSSIIENLQGFRGMDITSLSGADIPALYRALSGAIDKARTGKGPQLVHVHVPRISGHSIADSAAYKSDEERASDLARDPLPALMRYLHEEHGVSVEIMDAMREEIEAFVRAEADRAWATGGDPTPEEALDHLFAPAAPVEERTPDTEGPRINMLDAIRNCLAEELERDPAVLVFGEDVGKKGGVHGLTMGMQTRFGESRVFDTSLNEEGIIGRSIGMALCGLRPVPEIQFRKYADPAHEQITDAGSVRWRTDGRFGGPLVMRVPVGYGRKGGDPWHSVCGEAVFAHLPGWKIAYPSNAADAAGLLRTALRGSDPVAFLEHRYLYDVPESRRPYPGPDYMVPFGKAATVREGGDVLIVTWGDTVYRSIDAANEVALSTGAETRILDLRTIVPWDREAVLAAAREIGRVLIVHEDTITCGMGGEIAAHIADVAFAYLDAPVRRVASEDAPSPCHPNLFDGIMPTTAKIRRALEELVNY